MSRKQFFSLLFPSSFITGLFVLTIAFSNAPTGNIDGYVLPKEAKPYVEISIMQSNGDTVVKKAQPNSKGYFKLNNIPIGSYTLEYWPKNPVYLSKSKNVIVNSSQTTFADTVKLRTVQ